MLSFHRLVGLVTAPIMLVSALTGAVLVFAHEVDHRWDARLHVAAADTRLPFDSLLASVRATQPGCLLTDVMTGEMREPTDALIVRLWCDGAYREAIVNPYDGHVVGVRDSYFAKRLFDLHSNLWFDERGRIVLFALGVALVVLSVSGVFSQRRLGSLLRQPFRPGATLRVALGDMHRLAGVVSLVSNLVLGLTGMYLTSGAIVRALSPAPAPAAAASVAASAPPPSPIALDRALAAASAAMPGFRANWVVLPRRADAPIALWGEVPAARLYGMFGSSISLDALTGKITIASDVRKAGASGKLLAVATSLHFGDFGGLGVRVAWALLGLTPLLLAASGVVIAVLRRRRPARPLQ